jgi:hypothetical protein
MNYAKYDLVISMIVCGNWSSKNMEYFKGIFTVGCSFQVQVVNKVMRFNTNIPNESRLFIQVYPTSALLNTYMYCMYVIVLSGPVYFSKGVLV